MRQKAVQPGLKPVTTVQNGATRGRLRSAVGCCDIPKLKKTRLLVTLAVRSEAIERRIQAGRDESLSRKFEHPIRNPEPVLFPDRVDPMPSRQLDLLNAWGGGWVRSIAC